MSRSARNVPKEIALFGQRQFRETGASAVEVLRVKASTIRKHFSKMKGITFLVSVISRDRVRVYFFNSAGNMLIGVNIDFEKYEKVRKTSKLVTKFEKPRPLTKEELRIEATEELRQDLSKTLKRVVRFLGKKEPEFPVIFVTRESSIGTTQGFGLLTEDDGALVFEQGLLESKWRDGLVTRASVLQLLDWDKRNSDFSASIGNAIALASLEGPKRAEWLATWIKRTKETSYLPIVNHLSKHSDTYSWRGFARILDLVERVPELAEDKWIRALREIHDTTEVSLGTEEQISIEGFCKTLSKSRKLASKRHVLESIHLAPRVLCDPTSLGITLSIGEGRSKDEPWLQIEYLDGAQQRLLTIIKGDENPLIGIAYELNLEDVFPKSGGVLSKGNDVLSWILKKIGVKDERENTFQASIGFSSKEIAAAENAVLERLASGSFKILSDTLVGSPQRMDSLVKTGRVVLLPDFNHAGLCPNLLLQGDYDRLAEVASFSIESTIFHAGVESYALVTSPSAWRRMVLASASDNGVAVWPVVRAISSRRMIRSEDTFPESSEMLTWSEGKSKK
ncbi:MAG: hypothetical protein ACXAEE_07945 [Candidatus Thorarchaeota archaeon]